jgi:hypothetical protein
MALICDEGWLTLEQLTAEDSGILELARREGIDLQAKMATAVEDARREVEGFLRRNSAYGLQNAVADWQVCRWVVFRALGGAYRDAYFQQMNDRYAAKWRAFLEQCAAAREVLWLDGVGVVREPIRRAGKARVRITGGPHAARSYWFAASLVSRSGQEGAAGAAQLVTAPNGHGLQMSLEEPASGMGGWLLYAGDGPTELRLQTGLPMGVEAVWELPETGLVEGRAPGTGQAVEERIRVRRLLRRG